jgi:hypothetical protein
MLFGDCFRLLGGLLATLLFSWDWGLDLRFGVLYDMMICVQGFRVELATSLGIITPYGYILQMISTKRIEKHAAKKAD